MTHRGRAPGYRALQRMAGLLVGCLLIVASPARAQTKQPQAGANKNGATKAGKAQKKPWYQGVSRRAQDRATKLFLEGSALHQELFYQEAIEKYRQALKHWRHPDIQFNLTLALLSVGQTTEAYESLVQALRFGPISLSKRDYRRALDYRKRLEQQLAFIQVSCAVAGAQVTRDGKTMFACPGSHEVVVLPGTTRLVASKADHADDEAVILLNPGERKEVELKPLALDQVAMVEVSCHEQGASVIRDGQPLMACPASKSETLAPGIPHTFIIMRADRLPDQVTIVPRAGDRLKIKLKTLSKDTVDYKWPLPRWLSWTILGGSVAIGSAGGLLYRSASGAMNRFDRDFDMECNPGCILQNRPELASRKRSAQLRGDVAVGAMIIGGAGILATVVIELLNRPVAHRREQPGSTIVRPRITNQEIGIVAGIRF